MKLRAENTWTKVVAAEPIAIGWLDAYLSFTDMQRVFMQQRKGWGDGKLHLLNKRSMKFPTGLLSKVLAAAKEEGYEVEVEDARFQPISRPVPSYAEVSYLRDYQEVAVGRVFSRTRGIIRLPTGSGKTRISVALADRAPCHWLYLVHRANLMNQTAKVWEELMGQPAGQVGDKRFEPDPERRFTCATYQALKAAGKQGEQLLVDAEGLVCDEAHTAAAKTFWKIAMATRRAYWRCGLSATPLARGDKRSTYSVAALGPIIYTVRPQLLIERGFLSQPQIKVIPCLQEDSSGYGWQAAYSELVVRSQKRNALGIDMCRAADRPMLVFVKEIGHGKQVTEWLRAEMAVEFTWGDKLTPQREAAVQRLERGETDALVCSVVMQEGVDIPSLAAVVNLAGMKSTIAALQRLGRGSRIDGGRKKTFQVWDILDKGNKYIERHAKARCKAYRDESYTVEEITEKDLRGIIRKAKR